MIVRRGRAPADPESEERAEHHGASERLRVSDAGGLTQFGAHLEALQPGSRPSERHWREEEEEFLHVISGEPTVIEDDGAHPARPRRRDGPLASGRGERPRRTPTANAHQVVNPV